MRAKRPFKKVSSSNKKNKNVSETEETEELRLNLYQFWANIIQMSCHKKLSLKQFKIDKKGGQRDAVILKNYFGP